MGLGKLFWRDKGAPTETPVPAQAVPSVAIEYAGMVDATLNASSIPKFISWGLPEISKIRTIEEGMQVFFAGVANYLPGTLKGNHKGVLDSCFVQLRTQGWSNAFDAIKAKNSIACIATLLDTLGDYSNSLDKMERQQRLAKGEFSLQDMKTFWELLDEYEKLLKLLQLRWYQCIGMTWIEKTRKSLNAVS